MTPTVRLYLEDDRCFEADAIVVAVRDALLAFDRSCFYPGGGGQPPDEGSVRFHNGEVLSIASARADDDDLVFYLAEEEFRRRDDLLRTLEAKPPVRDGKVRVVEIQGFDAQACGGTHVHSTADVGRLSIYRTENKGRINKRLYVRLAEEGC